MPTDEQYRYEALKVESTDRISMDKDAKIERDPAGAWVQVWIYVRNDDFKDGNENGQFGVGA